jgi:RNA recognition motif-containing protein
VFIKFIPADVSEEELRKTFGEAGTIISVKIKKSV